MFTNFKKYTRYSVAILENKRLCVIALGLLASFVNLSQAAEVTAKPIINQTTLPVQDKQAGDVGGTPKKLDKIIPMEVTINGAKSGTWLFLERAGALYVERDAFAEWRIIINNDTKAIAYKGQQFLPLYAIPGFDATIDFPNQSVALVFSPKSFATTRLNGAISKRPVVSEVLPSVFLNYDINYNKSYLRAAPNIEDLSVLTELGASNNLGVITSSASGRNLTNNQALGNVKKSEWLRLETTFTKDFPERNQTLWIGDTTTRNGLLGRNVYFGGVKFGTNFSLTPGYVSQPLPALTGLSAAPSTVELYVNDVLRQVSEVPTGPFALNNFPILNGSGDARIVVRDLLGRETVIQQSFFTDSQLLAKDLNDWSVEAGNIRRDLGTSNANYGTQFISGLWRRGISNAVTLEGRGAITPSLNLFQAGAVTALPFQLLGRAAFASSVDDAVGSGKQWLLGVQHQGLRFSGSLELQRASQEYREVGQELDVTPIKQQIAGNISYASDQFGTFGLGYAKLALYNSPTVTTLSANYSMRVGAQSNLIMSANQASRLNVKNKSLGITLIVPLDNNRLASVYANTNDDNNDLYATYTQNPDDKNPLGWRVLAGQQQNNSRNEAGVLYYGQYGVVTGDVSNSPDQTAVRLGANGGLLAAESKVFATQRLTSSFALAEVKDYANVGVGIGNNALTKTNAKGVALIPRLTAYQSNSIQLNPQDLPISAEIDSIEKEVVPAWRSGVKIQFPVRSGRGALVRIVLDNNEPAPAGAVVNIKGDTQSFYVARRGEAFITGLQASNMIEMNWKDQQCVFNVTLPPEKPDEIPRLGPVICKGVKI